MKQFVNTITLTGLIMLSLSLTAQVKEKSTTEQIPKKVMDGLKAKFPKPEIDKWTKEQEGDIYLYDIEFKQGGRKFESDIKEDGTIDNWEMAITIKDLPEVVKMAVDKKYPKSIMQEIMQTTTTKAGKDELEGYEIVLKTNNKKDVEVTVAPDGKILEDSTDKK